MIAHGSSPERDSVASLTVSRVPGAPSGYPEVKEILDALRSIYPEERFTIEHRAVAIEGDLQIVFEVFDRESRRPEVDQEASRRDQESGWPF